LELIAMELNKPVFEYCEGDDCCDEEENREIDFSYLNTPAFQKSAESNLH
jgi:hypothetical protein